MINNCVKTGVYMCRYVGGAPGKIDLYVGKEVVRRSAPLHDPLVHRDAHTLQLSYVWASGVLTGSEPKATVRLLSSKRCSLLRPCIAWLMSCPLHALQISPWRAPPAS